MKYSLALVFIFLLIGNLQSQVNIKDNNIVYSSELKNLGFEPASPIIKLSYSVKKFVTGRDGIQFSVLVSPEKNMPIVNMDSILFTSTDYKFLTINKPYSDTTDYLINMNISYNAVHLLDDNAIKFLQNESVLEITFFVNQKAIPIKLNKKSQADLKRFSKSSF